MSKTQNPSEHVKTAVVVAPGMSRSVLRNLPGRMQAAYERVGHAPRERLDWLLSQLEKDDEKLREDLLVAESDFRLELACFGHARNPWEVEPAEEVIKAFTTLRRTLKDFHPDWNAKLTFPIKGTITKNFSVTPKQRRVRWSGAIESHYTSDHFPTAFLLAAAEVLEEEGLHVRECARPGCGRLFAHRKRGIFCSTSCSQKVRDQRYRERHSEKELRTHGRRQKGRTVPNRTRRRET